MPVFFDPAQGTTVVEPPGEGIGYWAGAPSAVYDADSRRFFLFYRLRKPVGRGRGWQCHVAESRDGVRFSVIWTATSDRLQSESIEGAALLRGHDGRFRLYVSHLDSATRRWVISLLAADTPESFDLAAKRVVLRGDDADSEGVKDPYVAIVDGRYHMFVHYAPRGLLPEGATEEELHATGNVFATEAGRGSAGLAVSDDGVDFRWQGDVLPPGDGWDRKLTRVDTMLRQPPIYTLFYSGRAGVEETYEDRTGIAVSLDLRRLHKLTDESPLFSSPWGTGALRYMDAVQVGEEVFVYYECARADGSHELRLNRIAR